MLVDDEGEANQIAADVRPAGQRIDIRRYVPPQGGNARG